METNPRPIDGDLYPPPRAATAARSLALVRAALVALGTFLIVFSTTFLLGGRGTLSGPSLGESASAQELVPSEPSFQTFGFLAGNPELLVVGQAPTTTAPADGGSAGGAAETSDGTAAPDGPESAPAAVGLTTDDGSEADEPSSTSASAVEDSEPGALPTPTPPPPPPPTATLPPPPTPVPATATPPPPAPPAAPSVSLLPLEGSLLAALNAARAEAGVAALEVDPTLVVIARMRSDDMVQRGYFDHVDPDGRTVFDILADFDMPYAWAGENLALNNYPVEEAVAVTVRDLMASPPHRANILNVNYTAIGVGLAEGSDGIHYFTMVFVGL